MQYDANGNMITKIDGAVTKEYIYDVENRLVEVKKNGDTIAKFEYDGDGGRTKKTVWTGSGLESQVSSLFVGSLFEIVDGKETSHVFLGSKRIASVTNGSPSFILDDHLGGVNVVTNADGDPAQLVEYKPFGSFSRNETFLDMDAQQSRYFTGQRLDDETGLYYYGARYYDPSIGRFITADPTVQHVGDPQDLNRYTYCRNNPVNLIDPSGLGWFSKFFKKVVGAVIGTVVGIASGNPFLGFSAYNAFLTEEPFKNIR